MSNNMFVSEKKKALIAYKEKIIQELKYYEKSIEEFRINCKNNSDYDVNNYSSDSEDDFPATIDTGHSAVDLKLQQSLLRTRLQATQELTSLTVLQSEVNVLVEEPKFDGEPAVLEAGTWREVTAECRVDLVPFSITFFTHTPHRKFATVSFRGLRVMLVKSAHEAELAGSVLHSLSKPSDAVEVLRSYAVAYRSRRTTLARLASKYTDALFMEAHVEGGFVLKCANLLEVRWRLENKRSPVAPFHHKMSFDLEYMDESYVKIISHSHKQLSSPSLQTDERTLILAKIISTCLEAKGVAPEESNESDMESKTTDNDLKKKDSEVMAPPKSLPKKVKAKNKENTRNIANTAQKRSIDDDGSDGSKKMRTSNVASDKNVAKETANTENAATLKKVGKNNDGNTETVNKDSNVKNKVDKTKKSVAITKNIATEAVKTSDVTENIVAKTKNVNADKNKAKTVQNPDSTEVKRQPANADDGNTKTKINKDKAKNSKESIKPKNVPEKNSKNEETNDKNKPAKGKTNAKNVANTEETDNIFNENLDTAASSNNIDKQNKKVKNLNKNIATEANEKTDLENNKKKSNATAKKQAKSVTKMNIATDDKTADAAVIPESKTKNSARKDNIESVESLNAKTKNAVGLNPQSVKAKNNTKPTDNITKPKNSTINKVTEKHANNKNKDKIVDRNPKTVSDKVNKIKNTRTINKIDTEKQKNTNGKLMKNPLKLKTQHTFKAGHIKGVNNLKAGSTEKDNGGRISRIPQKMSPYREKTVVNPLRISPRKFVSQFNAQASNKQKITKTITSIPRLMKKPASKN